METLRIFKITLSLPPKELSPNVRANWPAKARATRKYREYAWAVTLSKIGRRTAPQWKRATAQATFFFQTKRRHDKDNLLASLKAVFDGIADAGLVENDAGLTHRPVEIVIDPDGWEHVEIEVTGEIE